MLLFCTLLLHPVSPQRVIFVAGYANAKAGNDNMHCGTWLDLAAFRQRGGAIGGHNQVIQQLYVYQRERAFQVLCQV